MDRKVLRISDFKTLSDDGLQVISGGKRHQAWYAAVWDGVVSFGQGFLDAF